jgi:nicotinamide-nucleotide amidase
LAKANTTTAIMEFLMTQNELVSNPVQDLVLASEVACLLTDAGLTLATAESCTGGAIGALLTALPGSSNWFKGGVICYSNSSKINLLDVEPRAIDEYGAVSQEVVEAMAVGGCAAMQTDFCVAVSGIAGPGGGTTEKPVGSVWIAWSSSGGMVESQLYQFSGDRRDVQSIAVSMALKGIINRL